MSTGTASWTDSTKVMPRAVPRALVDAGVLLGFCVLAYTYIVLLPNIPSWPRSDSTVFLNDALRMSRGEVIYRDFFELTYPGTPTFYWIWIKLAGSSAWLPALTMIGLGGLCGWLTMLIARHVVKPLPAMLAGLVAMAFPVYYAPDPTHHWFSAAAILGATLVMLRARPGWAMRAGVLLGLSAFFTQTRGIVALMAVCTWVVWQSPGTARARWERAALVVLAFIATLAPLCAWFVWKAGPEKFWADTAVFLVHDYGSVPWNSWHVYLWQIPARTWDKLPELLAFGLAHALLPFVYVIFFVRFWRERARNVAEPWRELMLIAFVGLAMLASVAMAPSGFRLSIASLPAIVLMVWLLYQPGLSERLGRSILWAVTAVALVLGPIGRQHSWKWQVELPIGRVAMDSPRMTEIVTWLQTRTQPGEYCFCSLPMEYALQLRAGTPIPFVSGGDYTTPEQVKAAVAALESHQVPIVLVHPRTFFSLDGGIDHQRPFREYIYQNYSLVKHHGEATEVWVRKGFTLPQ